MDKPKKFYAVVRGRHPGIYTAWFGAAGAEAQIRAFPGARYRGFASIQEARQWMQDPQNARRPSSQRKPAPAPADTSPETGTGEQIVIYTDGACRGNPGRGGYGAVILQGDQRTEMAEGFRLTTNNRMELLACIAALESLAEPSGVVLHSDSSYVVNGIEKGWARKWRANHWMRTPQEEARNADLWARLLALCERHRVRFVWVRGHAGHPENERCDQLAVGAASGPGLREDTPFAARGPSQG